MANEPTPSTTPLAEISLGPSAFELFLDRNQKNLIVLLILLILAIVAFIIYRGVEDGGRLAAAHALYEAKDVDSLKKVVSAHPGTPAAQSAQILLAEQQWQKGEKDAAIETLRAYLSQANGHIAAPSARASLAAKLMEQGKTSEAVTAFEEILEDQASAYLAPYALLSLGDMAFAGGDRDKARQYYERAKSENPTSGFNQRISQRISGLSATMPAEIDPPPAPPQPSPAGGINLPATPSPLMPQITPSAQAPTPDATPSPTTEQNSSPSPDKSETNQP